MAAAIIGSGYGSIRLLVTTHVQEQVPDEGLGLARVEELMQLADAVSFQLVRGLVVLEEGDYVVREGRRVSVRAAVERADDLGFQVFCVLNMHYQRERCKEEEASFRAGYQGSQVII